jgi:hypothetical protein
MNLLEHANGLLAARHTNVNSIMKINDKNAVGTLKRIILAYHMHPCDIAGAIRVLDRIDHKAATEAVTELKEMAIGSGTVLAAIDSVIGANTVYAQNDTYMDVSGSTFSANTASFFVIHDDDGVTCLPCDSDF